MSKGGASRPSLRSSNRREGNFITLRFDTSGLDALARDLESLATGEMESCISRALCDAVATDLSRFPKANADSHFFVL
jgi:hypothetical protein